MKILFICLGNICRSPAAEAIMNTLITKAGLDKKIICDSAGTSAYHAGSPADPRMIKYAHQKGYNITHISRCIDELWDFNHFDWIITMDNSNYKDIMSLARIKKYQKKILKMADFCTIQNCDYIPDTYYQKDIMFLKVINLLENSCSQLLKHLCKKK